MTERTRNLFKASVLILATIAIFTCYGGLIDLALNIISEKSSFIFLKIFHLASLILVLATVLFGTDFLLMQTYARRSNHLDQPGLFKIIKQHSEKLGIAPPHFFILPEFAINSCSGGLFKSNKFIALTKGALSKLSREEQTAMIAHELAHLKNGDNYVYTVAAVFVGVLSSIHSLLFKHSTALLRFKTLTQASIVKTLLVISRALASGVLLALVFFFAPLFKYLVLLIIDKVADQKADKLALTNTRDREAMIGVLEKASECKEQFIYPAPALSHLFFMHPDYVVRDTENHEGGVAATRRTLKNRIKRASDE